jgi:prepilin-type N-terminal cleavage/methylation domain-containing protein
MRALLRDARGFSLTELLVAAAVLGVIMSGVLFVQMMGQQSYAMGSNRVEAQQNARVALDRMTRELRVAKEVTALGGASDITLLVDHDNNEATPDVSVRYELTGTTLNRTEAGTTTPLMGGVQALALTYCKVWNTTNSACATTASTAGDVRTIRIQLTAGTEESVAANSLADRNANVESMIRLRNVP